MIREIPRGVYSYFLGGGRGSTGQNGKEDCSPSQGKVEGFKVEVLLEYCGVSRGDEILLVIGTLLWEWECVEGEESLAGRKWIRRFYEVS